MRYWSDSNQHVLYELSLYTEKMTVWCGLWAGGVIEPYFFRDDQDVTVNGNLCRSMITEYFWPQLDDMDLEDMWFQQDGATQRASQSIYWKSSLENMLSHEMVQSVGRLARAI